jgi:hypothetical protein
MQSCLRSPWSAVNVHVNMCLAETLVCHAVARCKDLCLTRQPLWCTRSTLTLHICDVIGRLCPLEVCPCHHHRPPGRMVPYTTWAACILPPGFPVAIGWGRRHSHLFTATGPVLRFPGTDISHVRVGLAAFWGACSLHPTQHRTCSLHPTHDTECSLRSCTLHTAKHAACTPHTAEHAACGLAPHATQNMQPLYRQGRCAQP